MNTFINFIEKCKQLEFLQIFTIYLRYLIGAAFIISAFGLGKFSGQPLQPGESLDSMHPLQQFFRILSASVLYWQFIGAAQIVGGVMLMVQRLAKIGAIIFFVLILNIFVITVSYNFTGTPFITGLMLLATIFLLFWDLNSFQFILRKPTKENLIEARPLQVADHYYWIIVGITMSIMVFSMSIIRINLLVQLAVAFSTGLLAFVIYILFLRKRMKQREN